jgi:hypothetical protein
VLVEPLCRMDHALDEHSAQSQRVDPSTLPDVRWRDDRKAYDKKHKVRVGGCENLDCERDGLAKGVLTSETAHLAVCFDCEHVDETTKTRGISEMCVDLRKRPEAEWKDELDNELPKTRVLCRNCHHLKTNGELEPRYGPRVAG